MQNLKYFDGFINVSCTLKYNEILLILKKINEIL